MSSASQHISYAHASNISKLRVSKQRVAILRLSSAGVGPPMPRVEDQHIHTSPCIAALNGV